MTSLHCNGLSVHTHYKIILEIRVATLQEASVSTVEHSLRIRSCYQAFLQSMFDGKRTILQISSLSSNSRDPVRTSEREKVVSTNGTRHTHVWIVSAQSNK
ncbi:hypothetical protein TNCV_1881221 [Trichonephila clavipes]|nr:hypothetical protein TNCV_1881221 [Trichonephila clavipes]